MDETRLLRIRILMEALVSEREMMRALNEDRAMRGEGQAYGEEAFSANAGEFRQLARTL